MLIRLRKKVPKLFQDLKHAFLSLFVHFESQDLGFLVFVFYILSSHVMHKFLTIYTIIIWNCAYHEVVVLTLLSVVIVISLAIYFDFQFSCIQLNLYVLLLLLGNYQESPESIGAIEIVRMFYISMCVCVCVF